MKHRGTKLILSAFAAILALALGFTAHAQSASLLTGDWTGESICVGEIGACHDEQVVYHISGDLADATRVKIGADKIVDGKPDFMGDILLKYDAGKSTLIGELESPRSKGVWEFTVKGNMMWGTLSLLPEKRIVRQIRVTKNGTSMNAMANHATGTFEVKITPQDDKAEDQTLGRMTIEKQWQGEMQGTSSGQMLTGGDFKTGSAGYVAMEKFTGSVKGRRER